ncbi:hypothetical protein [Flammeovirga aprica]|uniref:DUF4163 domain-containing protein n=1 Tax=Flammeovirga aprica JL-4 TaxID=694437 RepID=A0A7X9RTU8_9BACT|nr:hypothetical protein [Flammeovirga aprica]NME67787.1 DUF4163 domain-containing protein [Flammeovirga aprica JL-4]
METIYWEPEPEEANGINCSISIEYPILNGEGALISEINHQIKTQISEDLEESKDLCSVEDIELEDLPRRDNELNISFEGGSNSHIISLVIRKYVRPLGGAYAMKMLKYYNYKLSNESPLYLDEVVDIEKIKELCWERALENNYEDSFTQNDLYNYLSTTHNSNFVITNEGLDIDLLPLDEDSYKVGEEISISLPIDDIEDALKIDSSLLP